MPGVDGAAAGVVQPLTPRVGVGGIFHESNSYCSEAAVFSTWEGADLGRMFGGTETYVGGALGAAGHHGLQAVPLFYAEAEPAGVVTAAGCVDLADALEGSLRAVAPVDAVVLTLHGAGIVAACDGGEGGDLEALVARRIRRIVGADTPIVATLDLHANVTAALLDTVDGLVAVREYPHIDMGDCGRRAMAEVRRLLDGGRARHHLERLPMLLAPTPTSDPAAAEVVLACEALRARPGVLDCIWLHGFPYVDGARAGASVVVAVDPVARADADTLARSAGAALWARRDRLRPDCRAPADAVRAALAAAGAPIVVNEASDNPGGGGGASLSLLRAVLEARPASACFGFLCAPEAVRRAQAAGVGETVEVELGRAPDELTLRGRVLALTDGRLRLRAMGAGRQVDLGPTACLVVDGVEVILASQRTQTLDPGVFLLHGIDVRRRKLVALKSAHHFRAGFDELAAGTFAADDPAGVTSLRVESFPRTRTPRPVWPLDADAHYPARQRPGAGG